MVMVMMMTMMNIKKIQKFKKELIDQTILHKNGSKINNKSKLDTRQFDIYELFMDI